jgi:hypothetical protein
VLATVAVSSGEYLFLLKALAYAGLACTAGTFVFRWPAAAVMVVAFGGVLMVFASHVQGHGKVSWDQAAAMAAFGLTTIAALMILVEQKGEPCASS